MWISVGDAAWALDPLSGNGIERAVNDGINAAAAINLVMRSGDLAPLKAHAVAKAKAFVEALRDSTTILSS